MAALEDFLPLIRQQISGPLDFMMTDAALEAAIVFCRESTLIRTEVNLDGVVARQSYTLTDLTNMLRPFKRLAVWDTSYEEPDYSRHHDCYPDLIAGVDYDVVSGNVITFRRDYAKARILLALEPVRGASVLPDLLYDEYAQAIAWGALERLFMMPGKPWTDEQRSAYYKARFTDGFHNGVRRHEFF